jgi:hypothetical protein
MVLSQEIYNRGVVLNPHGLYDLFEVHLDFVELDPTKWQHA